MEPKQSPGPPKTMLSPGHLDRMVRSGRVTAEEGELLRAGDADVVDDVMVGIRARHAGAKLDAAVAAGELDREEADRLLDRLRGGEHSPELRSWVNRITRRERDEGHLKTEGKRAAEGRPA